ncbi:hypothetical protein C6P46_001532 [Rhodotorula mucilaginosa]|uniref:ELMO domain-containing protein n=1 Tax=Rhodotorula mucilaginosa TaxID=5537 RepID=A0A9P6VTS2_RHOMI|nr:hypothetical protein C6P46_001532 [Rhodotorula mucilaginosa]
MASAFELWLTPTITLSLVLESESDVPSLSRFVSQWLLYLRPALLRQALAYELQQRPDLDVVSAGTLRVVDYAYWRATRAQQKRELYQPVPSGSLAYDIALLEGVEVPSVEHDLLSTALDRVLGTYAITEAAQAAADEPFPEDGSRDEQLRTLWRNLKPDTELPAITGKHWQEIGFQLQSLLYFAHTYGDRAAEIAAEAVNGGEHWYPFALASIHMTAFALELATSRDLQLFLLRSAQARPVSSPAASPTTPSTAMEGSPNRTREEDVDLEPFLRIASDLLLLFHAHWQQGGYTVMQFEQVEKAFRAALRPWIRRGILDGRALGWEKWDEGQVKLD